MQAGVGLGRYGVQLAVGVSFLFEVANIFQPHVVEVVVVASVLASMGWWKIEEGFNF